MRPITEARLETFAQCIELAWKVSHPEEVDLRRRLADAGRWVYDTLESRYEHDISGVGPAFNSEIPMKDVPELRKERT